MNKTLIHHSYVCFSLSAPVRHVACRERGRGTGRWPLLTIARYQGSTLEHVRSAEMKADRPLLALSWVRCPNPGCEVSWGGGEGPQWQAIGLLRGGERGKEGEVAKVSGLQGFTWADSLDEQRLFLERIYVFRRYIKSREKESGIHQHIFLRSDINHSPDWLPGTLFLLTKRVVVELWTFPNAHTLELFVQVSCVFCYVSTLSHVPHYHTIFILIFDFFTSLCKLIVPCWQVWQRAQSVHTEARFTPNTTLRSEDWIDNFI